VTLSDIISLKVTLNPKSYLFFANFHQKCDSIIGTFLSNTRHVLHYMFIMI